MTLYNLSIDALESILCYLKTGSKSRLLMTGDKHLMSKLTQITTDISVLPYNGVVIESLSQDDDGFHITTRYKSCIDMRESIELPVTDEPLMYGLLPFYYRNAKCATIHDVHLERAMKTFSNLEHLRVYLGSFSSQILPPAPNTLRSLWLDLHVSHNASAIIEHLPQTLINLVLCLDDGDYVYLGYKQALALPQSLETLTGVNIADDETASLLPRTLTFLGCEDLDEISPHTLPPNLTCIDAEWIKVSVLSHLPLRELSCYIEFEDSLLPLHSLTKLSVKIRGTKTNRINDWNSPVRFPPSITKLDVGTLKPICCLVHASVKKLIVSGTKHSMFEESTRTWRYRGPGGAVPVPDNVLHAIVRVQNASNHHIDHIFSRLQDSVETLTVYTDYCDMYDYSFQQFVKCMGLILPPSIRVTHLPPLLEYMDVKRIGTYTVNIAWPDTLRHICTAEIMSANEVSRLRLTYLECDGKLLLGCLACIAHIQTVVLRVPKEMKLSTMPVLPSNASYKFVN